MVSMTIKVYKQLKGKGLRNHTLATRFLSAPRKRKKNKKKKLKARKARNLANIRISVIQLQKVPLIHSFLFLNIIMLNVLSV